ncbi:hypothetical protein D6827_03635, partial [Candidatus Parcubacteria bacterium]
VSELALPTTNRWQRKVRHAQRRYRHMPPGHDYGCTVAANGGDCCDGAVGRGQYAVLRYYIRRLESGRGELGAAFFAVCSRAHQAALEAGVMATTLAEALAFQRAEMARARGGWDAVFRDRFAYYRRSGGSLFL